MDGNCDAPEDDGKLSGSSHGCTASEGSSHDGNTKSKISSASPNAAAASSCVDIYEIAFTIYERLRAQFRAEYLNTLNHSNFTTPNTVVFSAGPTPAKLSSSCFAISRCVDYHCYELKATSIRFKASFLRSERVLCESGRLAKRRKVKVLQVFDR